MATGAVAGDVAARVGDRRRPASKGLLMALVLSLAAAAFALVAIPQNAPPASSDVLVDQAMGPVAERPEAIRARFLAEMRDAIWAPAAEALLRTRYAQVRGAARPLRVICATTLCEVAGRAADGQPAIIAFEEEVQGKPFVDRLAADGLTSMSQAFGTPRDAPQSLSYAAYWQRKR